MVKMSEKHKIDLIRNKIQECNFKSVTFNLALVEQENLWRVLTSRIIFSRDEKKENETLLKEENFALENVSFSISEFENFLNYLENAYVGNVIKEGSTFDMRDELFFKFGNYKLCFVGNFPSPELSFYGRQTAKQYHGIDKPIFVFDYAINNLVSVRSRPRIEFTSFEVPLRNISEAINWFWNTNYHNDSISRECSFYFPIDDASIKNCEIIEKHITVYLEWEQNVIPTGLTLSIIADNNTDESYRKKISVTEKTIPIELGFVPSSASFFLNKEKEKLDEFNYYKPREEDAGVYFGDKVKKPNLSSTKNIVLFLGAGTSIQFDIPATKEFKEYLLQNDTTGVKILNSLLTQEEFPDIEHVLTCLKELLDTRKNKAGIYLGKQDNGILVNENPSITVNEIFGQSLGLYNFIMQTLFKKYQIEPKLHSTLNDFYGGLFELIGQYSNRIDVGTTNYDLAVETFCSLNASQYICIDGFKIADTKFIWMPNKYEELYKASVDIPILLYKIHGSLNWVKEGSQITKTEQIEYMPEKESSKNVLIAPTLSPKDASKIDPYKSILDLFSERLENSDMCVAIGTSFRDKIIAKKFVDFIEKGKHLVIISPSCYQNYAQGLYNQYSISELECVQWAKYYSMQKKGKVTFIDLPVIPQNYSEIFSKLKNTFEKN